MAHHQLCIIIISRFGDTVETLYANKTNFVNQYGKLLTLTSLWSLKLYIHHDIFLVAAHVLSN